MAHELDINADGTANAVYNRIPGWHRLGTTWQPGTDADARLNLTTALDLANLAGWDVRKVPMWAEDLNGDILTLEGQSLTVRNNPVDPHAPAQALGVVSTDRYRVVQNEEAFAWGENLLDEGLEVEAAGSLYGGKQVWVLYRVPTTVNVGGDEVYPYLLVTTSHDGSVAVTATLTGVRVQCANMMAMALSRPTPRYTCHHVGEGLEGKLADAREALGVAYGTLDTFQKDMQRWLDTPVTPGQWDAVLEANMPTPNPDRTAPIKVRKWEQDVADVRALYEVAPTNSAITGTAWGAAQALLEWHDWVKGTDAARARNQVSAAAAVWRQGVYAKTAKVLAIPAR